jgi:hypothetical protein
MCFEYDLVAAARPTMVVDVGAGSASSFFVFCQSIRDHDIDGTLFAVDRWLDDEGKQADDPTHSASINHHARTFFRGTTYLLRTKPEDALNHFDGAFLDLVRLDPERCDGALNEVLSAWLAPLAPGGLLLCCRMNEPEVRVAWDAISAGNRTFTMNLGGGLGVLIKGGASELSHEYLIQVIDSDDPTERASLEAYYEHAALHHSLRRAVRSQRLELLRQGRVGGKP